MTTKIVTDAEPRLNAYLVPASIRNIDFFDGAKLSASIPRIESQNPREVTQVLLPDGTVFFVFDSKVSARKGGCKLEIASQMIEAMPPKEFEKWVESRVRHESVPAEAAESRHESKALMMTVIEWSWWEVTW